MPDASEFYAVSSTVREGAYPGRVVSKHTSHWEAVREMLQLNRVADEKRRAKGRKGRDA